ncbi:MAG: hybrid sensor histidine kinase/response regulator [Syntrophus sp. (in: bacteria)]|nr:hybrid sensor histidine kinase/response regulator [Syntrophus sp. (in: bacteria)]
MDEVTVGFQERIEHLEKLLEEKRLKAERYKILAEQTEKQYLKETGELSEALNKRIATELELRESEERYRIAVEHSHDGVGISRDDIHIYANQRFAEIFGYDRPDDLTGKPSILIVHPDDRERVSNYTAMRQRGEPARPHFEFKGIKKNKALVYIEVSVTTIVYKGAIALLSCFRDITERRRMEEELLKTSKLESIGVLAGGIAHDFNNILTAIMGNISLAKMVTQEESPLYKRFVGAEQAVNRAKDLTRQLLTFSKGGTPIKKTTRIIHILEDSANFTLTGSNVNCFFSLPDNLWNVEVDEGQMSQVMQNLVINAKEAMLAGGTIEVRAENVILDDRQRMDMLFPTKGHYVKVAIKDQGIGIPEEHLDKIFDPFFTTKQGGSGLGLATSYSIIKKHGGFIHVTSHLGIGTTFEIYLPAIQEHAFARTEVAQDITTGKGKVLLMDDEEIVRDAIGEMLSILGYTTESAKDGAEAIDLYVEARKQGAPFDIVILDLTVPGGMGGKEAMEEFLEIDPKIKAIVSSGYSNNQIMSEFARYGFTGVMSKPYRLEELSETVSRVLKRSL